MELTWIALAASLFMGLGAACVFVFAVKQNYSATSKTPSTRSSGRTFKNW
ncbi:MAG: hypothetical protein QM757_47125 [Paludibaculum sp.]